MKSLLLGVLVALLCSCLISCKSEEASQHDRTSQPEVIKDDEAQKEAQKSERCKFIQEVTTGMIGVVQIAGGGEDPVGTRERINAIRENAKRARAAALEACTDLDEDTIACLNSQHLAEVVPPVVFLAKISTCMDFAKFHCMFVEITQAQRDEARKNREGSEGSLTTRDCDKIYPLKH